MRIHGSPDDKDYLPIDGVIIDGVQMPNCICADDETGEYTYLVKNDNGQGIKQNPNYNENLPKNYTDNCPYLIDTKIGNVEFIFNEKINREFKENNTYNPKTYTFYANG